MSQKKQKQQAAAQDNSSIVTKDGVVVTKSNGHIYIVATDPSTNKKLNVDYFETQNEDGTPQTDIVISPNTNISYDAQAINVHVSQGAKNCNPLMTFGTGTYLTSACSAEGSSKIGTDILDLVKSVINNPNMAEVHALSTLAIQADAVSHNDGGMTSQNYTGPSGTGNYPVLGHKAEDEIINLIKTAKQSTGAAATR